MKIKILIADDKEENLYMLESLLKGSGYEVISATNGEEALGVAIKNPPALIITDILMPIMDGFTLCKKWRNHDLLKNIPFVFYTATYTDPKDEEFALSLGADQFLLKPQDPDDFINIIKDLLIKFDKGELNSVSKPILDETIHLKEYNQALIRKLEDKISDVEELNKKLKLFLKRYKTILSEAPDAIFLINKDAKIIEVNNRAIELFGYTSDEFLELEIHLLHIDEDRAEVLKSIQKTFKGERIKSDWKLKRKDGTLFDGSISAWFIPEIGFQAIIRDITDRLLAEEALREREKQFRTLYENVIEIIFYLDVEGEDKYRFQSVNPAFLKATGLKISQVIGKLVNKIIPEPSLSLVLSNYRKAIQLKESVRWEEITQYPTGNKVGDVTITPIFDEQKICTNLIGTVYDITERKQTEEKIKEALIKAEESDRLKSSFLANMSHEIRTPMNAIIGFSNLMANAKTEEKREEFIRIITSNGDHLLSIINDLIDLSKIEAGIIKIENQDCNINHLLNEFLDIFRIKEKIKNKEIEISLIKGLPDNNANIISDSTRLNQVIINLLENAYKFTNKGKIEIGYTIIQDDYNYDFLEFFVRDTGEGIEKSKQKMIFERFSQEDSSTTRLVEGTGLGLTISRSIVYLLGGDIWVESLPGQGSTFYFTVPYNKGKYGKKIIKSSHNTIIDWSNNTILVAEDIDDSYYVIENMLTKTNAKIIRAINGLEAIEICRKDKHINLVLMDIRMPVKNGYEAMRKIKIFRPDLPIIAQTAYAITGDKEKALKAGFDDYLAKPIKTKLLIEKINVWLEQ